MELNYCQSTQGGDSICRGDKFHISAVLGAEGRHPGRRTTERQCLPGKIRIARKVYTIASLRTNTRLVFGPLAGSIAFVPGRWGNRFSCYGSSLDRTPSGSQTTLEVGFKSTECFMFSDDATASPVSLVAFTTSSTMLGTCAASLHSGVGGVQTGISSKTHHVSAYMELGLQRSSNTHNPDATSSSPRLPSWNTQRYATDRLIPRER